MCEPTPDFKRVETTLHHEEPDRVPLAEVAIDYSIMSQFLGRPVADEDVGAQVEFWSRAGYDYILLTAGMMRPGGVTKDSHISKVIEDVVVKDEPQAGADAWNVWKHSRIHSESDIDAFPWEEAGRLDLSKFFAVQPLLPEGMKIIAASGKIFTLTWMLMGFENFGVNLLIKPDFVSEIMERVARIQLQGLREIAAIPNVAAVWAVDDVAFGTGPIVSPRALRRHLFPWYEEFGSICREEGLYFFFHSDGVLWDVMDDLLALGVDALHPIDPSCMDIEEAKQNVGKRVCLVGNISNEILAQGTPDEVADLTERRLKTIGPGGGYCLGSGNSVPDWAQFENYMAMRETALRYGRYPISID